MKNMKKIFALLLAVVMVMGLSVTAFAENDGSITIENPTDKQTYTAYKIFNLTYSGDDGSGNPTAYSYTATEAQKVFYEDQENNPFAFEKNSVGTYNVSVGKKSDGTSYSDADVTAFLQSFITTDSDGKVSIDTRFAAVIGTGATGKAGTNNDGDDIVTISNLPYGYYFVTSTVGTVLTISSTTPNVTVKDKNGKPDADKDVKEDSSGNYGDSNTAGIGDTVEFRTKVTIPVGTVNLVLHDDMSTGLTLAKDSIVVYTDENLQTALAEENYTVKTSDFAEGDTCEFEVAFKSDYLNSLTTSTDVYVYYKATVSSSATIGNDGNTNVTHVSYGNDSDVTSTPSTTTTKVWEFDLHKYANDDTNGYLANAEFVLSYTEGTGDNAVTKYAQLSEIKETIENEEVVTGYKLTGWVGSKDSATRIVTNNVKAINIEGLDTSTYALSEVKAPDGYNLLNADVTVVIDEDGTVSVGGSTVNEVSVQNQSGKVLPSTGGIGTTIFYVVGTILVLGAAILLITKKRLSGREE